MTDEITLSPSSSINRGNDGRPTRMSFVEDDDYDDSWDDPDESLLVWPNVSRSDGSGSGGSNDDSYGCVTNRHSPAPARPY